MWRLQYSPSAMSMNNQYRWNVFHNASNSTLMNNSTQDGVDLCQDKCNPDADDLQNLMWAILSKDISLWIF